MTVDTFYILLEIVFSKLQKHNWKALAPELRLSVTLRYVIIILFKFICIFVVIQNKSSSK